MSNTLLKIALAGIFVNFTAVIVVAIFTAEPPPIQMMWPLPIWMVLMIVHYVIEEWGGPDEYE